MLGPLCPQERVPPATYTLLPLSLPYQTLDTTGCQGLSFCTSRMGRLQHPSETSGKEVRKQCKYQAGRRSSMWPPWGFYVHVYLSS